MVQRRRTDIICLLGKADQSDAVIGPLFNKLADLLLGGSQASFYFFRLDLIILLLPGLNTGREIK